ncbi:MAG: hypothetical protein M1270_05300 [Gammaproteobacteria bacterium]|nr:hypothetical protein [Gammaproteobacteria bacterium]
MPLISFFDFPAMTIFFGEPQANTRGAFSFGSFSLIRDIHVAHPLGASGVQIHS